MEEAVDYAKRCIEVCKLLNMDDCPEVHFFEAAKSALEKRTPKKPVVHSEEYTLNFKCPDCGCRFISKIDGEYCCGSFYKHCYICGQAIDWSE